jgi:RimJ/RimL family protein N-acetyltransferase
MDVKLRAWQAADAPGLAAIINNRRIQDNLRDGIPYPYAESDAQKYILGALGAQKDSQYAWAVTANGQLAGSIGVFRRENIHRRTAEMGYFISEPWWGRGIATLAVREACEFIFACTDILRIFAEPFAENAASCRVLEKAGFVLEGTMRKNAVKGGRVLDMKLYARVRLCDERVPCEGGPGRAGL